MGLRRERRVWRGAMAGGWTGGRSVNDGGERGVRNEIEQRSAVSERQKGLEHSKFFSLFRCLNAGYKD